MIKMDYEGMFSSIFRSIFAGLDSFIYKILAGLYNVFFNVATADVLKAELMKNLLGRIQIILGVIILFKLVISFFSGIVNPEGLGDSKKGFGNVIKRVVVVLVMLLLITPLNIPNVPEVENQNELKGMDSWNKNMNTHGILFGSLYELQKRVLKEDLLFKIINGNSNGIINDDSYQADVGENFAKDVLRTFFTVNVVYDGADYSDHCEGTNEDFRDTNCVCTRWKNQSKTSADSDIDIAMPIYFDEESTIDMLLQSKVVNAYCDDVSDEMSHAALQDGEGTYDKDKATAKFNDDTYAFAYSYFWSTVVGVLFCILILSLAVDVAVRVFKLVLLEIVSPVAILSYIDPSSEKTFNNWTKALTETYLAVFIRVAIISLILFMIKNISLTGFGFQISTGFVGFVSKILIYFGLILFAKEAPKFITQSLGIESKNAGLFDGIKKLKAGKALAGGGVSGAVSKFNATQGNVGKKILAAIGGVAGGLTTAGKEFMKDGSDAQSIKRARRRYADQNYERAADESTFIGRRKAAMQADLGFRNEKQKLDKQIKYFESAGAAMQRISNAFDGNGSYKFKLDDKFKDIVDQNGNVVMGRLNADGTEREYTLKEMKDILNRVNASGDERLIREVDAAMKNEQGRRLDHLRTLGRTELEKLVKDRTQTQYTENDLIAYDGAERIYNVATLYKDEPSFSQFFDKDGNMYKFAGYKEGDQDRLDPLGWGPVFKTSAGQAGKKAEAIKTSDEYARATANAKRAEEEANKK